MPASSLGKSRVLATIVTDVELDAGLEAWRCREPDRPKARELFDQLEFRSLAAGSMRDDSPRGRACLRAAAGNHRGSRSAGIAGVCPAGRGARARAGP